MGRVEAVVNCVLWKAWRLGEGSHATTVGMEVQVSEMLWEGYNQVSRSW